MGVFYTSKKVVHIRIRIFPKLVLLKKICVDYNVSLVRSAVFLHKSKVRIICVVVEEARAPQLVRGPNSVARLGEKEEEEKSLRKSR